MKVLFHKQYFSLLQGIDKETSIGRKIAHQYPATFQEDGKQRMPYMDGHP